MWDRFTIIFPVGVVQNVDPGKIIAAAKQGQAYGMSFADSYNIVCLCVCMCVRTYVCVGGDANAYMGEYSYMYALNITLSS